MVLPNPHTGSYPASPTFPASPMRHISGNYLDSFPASSTPTLDISFDRPPSDASSHRPPPPLWPHRLSASFSAMADQIAAASQALALVPSTAFSGSDVSAELSGLKSRLEGIEQTQGRMVAEFEALKQQFTTLGTDQPNGQVNGGDVDAEAEAEAGEGEGETKIDAAAQAAKIEELEKKLNALSESVKLDQERLPARLQNSRATVMKALLNTPVAANGKPAAGFPATRGEFEHITKERYEALLKAYGLPLKGDTAAKREALRTFAGIPQDGQ